MLLSVSLMLAGCAAFQNADIRRGDRHVETGNWEEAVVSYQQANRDDPFDRSLQAKLALARSQAANQYDERARLLLKDHRIDQAVEALKRALTLEPSNLERHMALSDAMRLKEAQDHLRAAEQLQGVGRLEEALEAYRRAAGLDFSLTKALEGIAALSEKQSAGRKGDKLTQPITLRFQNAKIKEVFEVLARAGGINIVFDKDVKNDPISIFIQDTPFEDALSLILSSNGLFSLKVDADTLLVSPNTKPKQEQYTDQVIRTFYLTTVKAKDMVALLKGMLDTKRMYANEQVNAVVLRDQPDKIKLAERIINANDRPDPEVLFDVEVLELNRTKSLKYGLTYGKSITAQVSGAAGTANPGIFLWKELKSLGDQTYLFSLPPSVTLDFLKQDSDARTLASPKLRVVNKMKGEVNIGDKQPILLSTTNVLPGQVTTGSVPTTSTATSVEFRDTGIKLSVEPTVRLLDELALKMKLEVTRLGDLVTLQASPPIQVFRFGTRTAETTLQMKDGETIVLAGLIQDEDRKTRSTIPWLGDLPFIGWLFSAFTTDKITTEVILTITPHIIQPMVPASQEMQTLWSGTEFMYSTKPMFPGGQPKPVSFDGLARDPKAQAPAPTAPLARPLPPPSAAAAALAPTVTVKPKDVTAETGQEFQVAVQAESVDGLEEASVTVEFDPKILEFRRVEAGEMLNRGGAPGSVSVTPTVGGVTVTVRRQGPAISGSGTLAQLTFASKGVGVSPLSIQAPTVRGQGKTNKPAVGEQAMVRVR